MFLYILLYGKSERHRALSMPQKVLLEGSRAPTCTIQRANVVIFILSNRFFIA